MLQTAKDAGQQSMLWHLWPFGVYTCNRIWSVWPDFRTQIMTTNHSFTTRMRGGGGGDSNSHSSSLQAEVLVAMFIYHFVSLAVHIHSSVHVLVVSVFWWKAWLLQMAGFLGKDWSFFGCFFCIPTWRTRITKWIVSMTSIKVCTACV